MTTLVLSLAHALEFSVLEGVCSAEPALLVGHSLVAGWRLIFCGISEHFYCECRA